MADQFDTAPRFSVGRVLGTSFSVLMRNIVPFGLIAAIVAIPYIALFFLGYSSQEQIRIATAGGHMPPGFVGVIVIIVIVSLLTTMFTQAAINYGTFLDLSGQHPSFGACLGNGLANLPKVLVAAILASLAFMAATLLLVVPGVILYLMWWVFVPVIVVESAGITACFGRSRELTRGHRWGILGLVLIVGVAQWLIGLVFTTVGAILGTVANDVIGIVVTLLFTAFASVLTAVGYYYLRAEKEGVAINDIAKVFD